MFSERVPGQLVANRLSRAVAALRAEGVRLVDLTESNPTRAELDYPPTLLAPLADARGLRYEPEARGLPAARRAVAGDYARRGVAVDADRIVFTAGTSEAYGVLFKLLADAGDEVLVPRPSYPLFDYLARFDAVAARPYDLDYHGAWTIDFASVEAALSPRTRALLLVSPNNPTGSFVKRDELERIASLCAPKGIALIADEVFADYELDPGAAAAAGHVLDCAGGLAFSLGGLSKSIGLPQLKLGWLAAAGERALVAEALERLDLICDTYLSVSTPVQAAAPELLAMGAAVRDQITARVTRNLQHLVERTPERGACRVLRAEGGWSAVLRVPALEPEEDLVLDLLQRHHVLAHPGYFFDFPRGSHLVVSLLPPPHVFEAGVRSILRHFDCSVGTT